MAIDEVFPNPTVKHVIFQIRYPNLFFLESRIGDFQLGIMERFPESSLLVSRQVVFADIGPGASLAEIPNENDRLAAKRIWQFRSKNDIELNVTSDALDINSKLHKTYSLGNGENFRDIIKIVIDHFLKVMGIPNILRLGLRYIDECPIPTKDNNTFKAYYNSVFPLERFALENANEMDFKTVIKLGAYYIRYIESLQKVENSYRLILDFDGFSDPINSNEYLSHADRIHELISAEYEKTIKEPVYAFMRIPKEGSNES